MIHIYERLLLSALLCMAYHFIGGQAECDRKRSNRSRMIAWSGGLYEMMLSLLRSFAKGS